ncbi:hypothetical protein UFOVP176_35 [uncultured Caudovirales phage]|uniref:Uncharacterized protein n=1 Tax=uncultured Caudovirales phage TaxID=2100421 RepID=A0A6J7WC55_9CAUD|nr:hypothetical protein UFOVP176_35 [uncultured Caudovirales phage]
MTCPKCRSPNWDYANVGMPYALVCLDCGDLYGEKRMTESDFESKFENGELDCEFAMFISERYDAWSKPKMLSYWEDTDAYLEFKDSMVKEPLPMLKDTFFEGSNPLDKFPSIWSSK